MPTSVAYIGTGQIMGWGNKAIEVYSYIIFIYKNLTILFLKLYRLDSFRGDWPFRRCVYAQKVAATQVPLRAQRQSVLQQCQRCVVVSNLFHDT